MGVRLSSKDAMAPAFFGEFTTTFYPLAQLLKCPELLSIAIASHFGSPTRCAPAVAP
jgi:hypothetical protein